MLIDAKNRYLNRRALAAITAGSVALSLSFIPACTTKSTAQPPIELNAKVVKVVDGDTVEVETTDRSRIRIRVIGMDSPERVKPHYSKACWSWQASDFAHRLLDGKPVAVVTDPGSDVHDIYGRTLAGIFLADGTNFAVESVRQGNAHAYVYGHKPSIWANEIQAAENEAKSAGRGLWGPTCGGHTESVRVEDN